MELLTLASVIGLSMAWQRWQGTSAAAAVLHAVSAMIVVLFVFSLAGLLMPAAILLLLSGVLFAAIEGGRVIRDGGTVPVPYGMFALLGVAYWLVNSDAQLFFYDEYSHWGIFLREMLGRNALWGADSNALHPRYLPGTALWQYFFAMFSSKPEGAAYLAQFTLLLAPLLVLWERLTWKEYPWIAGILALVVICTFNFGHGFTSLYVDHVLGTWLAGILLNYLLDRNNRNTRQMTSYLLPLSVLVLTKTLGVFFAMAAAGIMSLLLLAESPASAAVVTTIRRWLRAVSFAGAAGVVCLAILLVWNANRDSLSLGGTAEASSAAVVSHLVAGESVLNEAQQDELYRRFKDVVLHQQISKNEVSRRYNAFSYPTMPEYTDRFRLTTASLLGFSLIAIILFLSAIARSEFRRPWLVVVSSVWIATVIYIIVLYLGTLYMSPSVAGLNLSSYVRYTHSMLLPLVLICFAALLPAFAGKQPRVRLGERLHVARNAVVFFALLVAFCVFEPPYLKTLLAAQNPPEFRAKTESLTTQVREGIGDSSLWVLFPSDFSNGLLGRILQYGLSPGRTHVEVNPAVIFDQQAELQQELRNWQYIWFPASDPELDAAIEQLVGGPLIERIYRIDSSGTDVRFIPAPGILPGSEPPG